MLIEHTHFKHVANLIQEARKKAYLAVNRELIDLYWSIGQYLSEQTKAQAWGKAVVQELANYLATTLQGQKGFSAQNLWRMKQFYEFYHASPNLSTLLREIPWSHNMAILSSADSAEEKEFYIR